MSEDPLCCVVVLSLITYFTYSHMKLATANYNPLFPGLSVSFVLIGPCWQRGTRFRFWERRSVRTL